MSGFTTSATPGTSASAGAAPRAAYERWSQFDSASTVHPALQGVRASGLDSLLAEGSDDAVFVVDAQGTIIGINPALDTRLTFDGPEFLGEPLASFFSARHAARIASALADTLRGDGVRVVSSGVGKDGEWRDLVVSFIPVRNAGGADVVGAVVIAKDISEEHTLKRERQRSGRLLALAGRLAGFAGWSLDLETGELIFTERGLTTDARLGTLRTLDDLAAAMSQHHAAVLQRAIARTVAEGRSFDISVALAGVGEEVLHLRLVGEPVHSDDYRVVAINGAVHDITQAVIERQQRLEVEEMLTSTLNSISDGLAVVDGDWTLSYANPRLEDIFGVSADRSVGLPLWDVVPGLAGSEFEIAFRRAITDQTTVRVRDRIERLDCWLEATAYPSGSGLAIHIRDVTEFEVASSKVREAEDRMIMLSGLLDISHDAIIVRDLDDRVQYWNRGAADLYGWEPEEAVGGIFSELVGVQPEPFRDAVASVVRDGRWAGTLTCVTRGGRTMLTDSRWQVVQSATGEPEAIFSVCSDVTEHRRRDDALRRARRLESIGTVAGGMAHDLNNVLTPILMAAQLLASGPTSPGQSETLSMIESAATRGADMVRQVLAFSRGVDGRREDLSIDELLVELAEYCREALPGSITVTFDQGVDVGHVRGDATQLMQVLMNLVTNARDAMPTGGAVTVSTRALGADESPDNDLGDGPWIAVDVEDDGTGMSAEVLDKLFEPFFTTKAVGSGTGLGLATSFAIARSHGGDLIARSDGRTGSRFTVLLPQCQCEWQLPREGSTPLEEWPRGQGQTVLVVDDEEAIRAATRRLLEHYGYRVVVSANGVEALELVVSGAVRPDVLLSDVTMPRMNGIELVSALRAAGHDTPVVLTSGLTTASGLSRETLENVTAVLDKPFTSSQLLGGPSPGPHLGDKMTHDLHFSELHVRKSHIRRTPLLAGVSTRLRMGDARVTRCVGPACSGRDTQNGPGGLIVGRGE